MEPQWGALENVLQQCAGCLRKPGPGEPALQRCTLCLTVRYCGKDCQRRGWKIHKGEACRKMAVLGFRRTIQQLAGPSQDGHQWALDTMLHVMSTHTLPSGVSLRQIDDLVALQPTALPYMSPGINGVQPLRYGVLALAGACVLSLERDHRKQEAFVADALAALSLLEEKSHDDDETRAVYADAGVVSMSIHCGDVMCRLGRQRDATEMARRLRPLVESAAVAAHAQNAECTAMHGLVTWLKKYATWLLRYAPPHSTISEAIACAEYSDRHGLLMRAIDIATSDPRMEFKLEGLFTDLAMTESICGRYTSALKWAQRAIKAESLIKEALAKAARLRVLDPLLHAVMLHYQAIILGRRGKHEASLLILDRAEAQARAVPPSLDQSGPVKTAANVITEVRALRLNAYEALGNMDKVKELEEAMGDEKWRRSEYVVRQAQAWVAAGQRDIAVAALWRYAQNFASGGYQWRTRGRRRDAGLRPLELLWDYMSDDGNHTENTGPGGEAQSRGNGGGQGRAAGQTQESEEEEQEGEEEEVFSADSRSRDGGLAGR